MLVCELGSYPSFETVFLGRFYSDVFIVGARNFSGMTDRPGWKRIRAIQTDRLCEFSLDESDMLVRPGPRMAEAARLMAACLARQGGKA